MSCNLSKPFFRGWLLTNPHPTSVSFVIQLLPTVTTIRRRPQELVDIVRLYPTTLIIPVLVFMLLAGLGVWGVLAGAQSHVQQQKDDVYSRAVDAATGFQVRGGCFGASGGLIPCG
jgi:hypothetical protein